VHATTASAKFDDTHRGGRKALRGEEKKHGSLSIECLRPIDSIAQRTQETVATPPTPRGSLRTARIHDRVSRDDSTKSARFDYRERSKATLVPSPRRDGKSEHTLRELRRAENDVYRSKCLYIRILCSDESSRVLRQRVPDLHATPLK
jgi:hypothetical protein